MTTFRVLKIEAILDNFDRAKVLIQRNDTHSDVDEERRYGNELNLSLDEAAGLRVGNTYTIVFEPYSEPCGRGAGTMSTKRHCDHCDSTVSARWIEVDTEIGLVEQFLASGQRVIAADVAKLEGDYCSPQCLAAVIAAAFPPSPESRNP